MLPLTFINSDDYEKVGEADRVSLVGLSDLAPGKVRTLFLLSNGKVKCSSKCPMNYIKFRSDFHLDLLHGYCAFESG